ncbi:MAG: hypothetical protein DRJ42_19610 [Deltaproteobacteria bacterium]|nr:MAG: hypothetical protein DRJ42_19610 [Deltaproteobacteria bacterium]
MAALPVAPLDDGRRFEVEAADLEVVVVGTVFECLVRLGWNEAARMRAHTYLRRFPNGSLAGWMRDMVRRAS